MSILLSKHHDITTFCGEDSARVLLHGVHYNKDKKRLEATDGRILIQVPIEEGEKPPVELPHDWPPEDCTIPAQDFREAIAAIPERPAKPEFAKAVLLSDQSEHAVIASTDSWTERAMRVGLIEGEYPKIDMVFPTEPPKFTIRLNKEYLKKLADYACVNNSNDGIKCEFWDDISPMRFTIKLNNGKEAIGLLMPMRIS